MSFLEGAKVGDLFRWIGSPKGYRILAIADDGIKIDFECEDGHKGYTELPQDVVLIKPEDQTILHWLGLTADQLCSLCHGRGRRRYGSTATWRQGLGGMTLTEDVCDKCWGTGRSDKTGPNLRRVEATIKSQANRLDNIRAILGWKLDPAEICKQIAAELNT